MEVTTWAYEALAASQIRHARGFAEVLVQCNKAATARGTAVYFTPFINNVYENPWYRFRFSRTQLVYSFSVVFLATHVKVIRSAYTPAPG